MKRVDSNEILNGNIIIGLIKMAIPLIFLNFIYSLYSVIDTFFVGQLGELQVGAISLISPIMECGNAFSNGLSAAGMALISMNIGANRKNKANEIATHLIMLSFILGLLLAMFFIVFAPNILNWLQTPKEIYNDSYWYLVGISFDFLWLFILALFQAIKQSNGNSHTGVIINMIAVLLNCVLDPLFIFTFDLKVFGAALATMLSKFLVVPLCLYLLTRKNDTTYIDIKKYKLNFQTSLEIFRVAFPASAGYFLSSFGFVLMNKNIIEYGSLAMSGYGVGNRISSLFYIPLNSFSAALTPFIGQNYGANNLKRCKLCFKLSMYVSIVISIILTIVGFISIKYAVLLFIPDASNDLIALASQYAYYSVGTAIFMGWFNNLSAVFNGVGKTKYTLYFSTFRLWGLRLPFIYLFSRYTNFGVVGIWWSMILSNFLTCILGQMIYRVLMFKDISND